MSDGAGSEGISKKERGLWFTVSDAICIANDWVRQSSLRCNQRDDAIWKGISQYCREQ